MPKLQNTLRREGLARPLYDVQWDQGVVQLRKLETPLLDIHHKIAAAQVALRIPLCHCSVDANKCQGNIADKPKSEAFVSWRAMGILAIDSGIGA